MSHPPLDHSLVRSSAPIPSTGRWHALVLLHGYGANELDLLPLAQFLQPDPMDADQAPLVAVAPRAPRTIPFAPHSYAWTDITDLGQPDPQQVAHATEQLWLWLEQWRTQLPTQPASMSVLGFSQGGMMATQLLRTKPDYFQTVVNLSGFVAPEPVGEQAALAARDISHRPHVFFGFGERDQVIPSEATVRTAHWLAQHTRMVKRAYPQLAHEISQPELVDVQRFLAAARDRLLGEPT